VFGRVRVCVLVRVCFFAEGSRRGRCGLPYGVAVPCDFSFPFFAPGSGPPSNIIDFDVLIIDGG
jgi:hypothetical protein